MDYDPLLSKLIAWGNSREETIARLRRALDEYSITGIKHQRQPFPPHPHRTGISSRRNSHQVAR